MAGYTGSSRADLAVSIETVKFDDWTPIGHSYPLVII